MTQWIIQIWDGFSWIDFATKDTKRIVTARLRELATERPSRKFIGVKRVTVDYPFKTPPRTRSARR